MSIAEKLQTIAENEQRVYDAGASKGYNNGKADGITEGYDQGHTEGYNEGYGKGSYDGRAEGFQQGEAQGRAEGIEEGKQAEYDRFWDGYQGNGNATYYNHRFAGQGWNRETFRPKYNIVVVGSADRMIRLT